MGCAHSKSVNVTSTGNERLKGLIEERDGTNNVTKGLDQSDTTQLNRGECSEPRRFTEETTNLCTNESSQADKSSRSEHGQKFEVFLSHSGKQKNFVRQLYRDLTNQGVSCFFDQDRQSLPLAEHFPSRIFEAAKTCKVAVLLLSKDFLESKWPMLELSAFVEARDITRTNPNLKILPVFFLISPDALKNTEENDEKWKQLEISREKRTEWHRALDTIKPISGLRFGEGGNEVDFRDEIVKEIWHIHPTPSPRYHVRGMQGEERLCRVVANFFNKVQPNENGIRIAGLYGIAGRGKTTLGKAFCNFKLGDFEGKVCHLEFSRGDPIENIKVALLYLTGSHFQTMTSQDQAQVQFRQRVKGQRVLLVLDNITEERISEVRYYAEAEYGENSWILLSARSDDLLVKHFDIDSQSCMRVPRLEEDEAIAILLERAFPGDPTLGAEDRGFALKCAKRCLFKETSSDINPITRAFHPLALKAFGLYLNTKFPSNLSKWADEINGKEHQPSDGLNEVFAVIDRAFNDMSSENRTIFMLLSVYKLPNMSRHKVTEWMAISCNEEVSFINEAVEDLRQKAFVEEIEPEISMHDLYIEFAQSKAKEMDRWLLWKGDGPSTRRPISKCKDGFELAKLEQCMYQRISPSYLGNLLVLQLVDVQDTSKLDLGPMERLRSITLRDCKSLAALDGMEKLLDLGWLQIIGVDPIFKLPELSSLGGLQYLEIIITGSQVLHQLGDLIYCSRLREIKVLCPSLLEFPKLKGMKHLEKVEFSVCDKVKGPLDCTECLSLQTVVLDSCSQMAASPLLAGCEKLSKIVMRKCDAVTSCPDIDAQILSKVASEPKGLESCNELENLQLSKMGELKELPSFIGFSNLTVLVLCECGIREPPDLRCCGMLEDVYFFKLENLVSFPEFSLVKGLKKLRLYECMSVEASPDVSGCEKLQFFHLVHNDSMKGLPKMGKLSLLKEIKLSWNSEEEATDGAESLEVDGSWNSEEGATDGAESLEVDGSWNSEEGATDGPESLEVDGDGESRVGCFEYEEGATDGPESLEVDGDGESRVGCFEYEELQNLCGISVAEALKELQLVKNTQMLVKQYFRGVKLYYSLTASLVPNSRKFVLRVDLSCDKCKRVALQSVSRIDGIDKISVSMNDRTLTYVGTADPVIVVNELRKFGHAELMIVSLLVY